MPTAGKKEPHEVLDTLDYYNRNAAAFTGDTLSVDFSNTQERFLSCLGKGAKILDFGCGAGRDAKCFLDRGFEVDAVDGSEQMCKIATGHTGLEVRRMLFEDFHAPGSYDGIWACASILHLPRESLAGVMSELILALRPGGVIYTSFKHGDFEGERKGRYFTDFTRESFLGFLDTVPGHGDLIIGQEGFPDIWVTGDVRPGRGSEQWLNIMLKKGQGR